MRIILRLELCRKVDKCNLYYKDTATSMPEPGLIFGGIEGQNRARPAAWRFCWGSCIGQPVFRFETPYRLVLSHWPSDRGNVEAGDLIERGISVGSELRCNGRSTRRPVTYQDEKKRSSSSVVLSKAVPPSGTGGG